MFNKWIIIVLLGIIPECLYSQSVGLVLSGGGSKGLAHIGVIKALEESHIPIDYIGGTSIGAIVGSLYAMGLTTDEMLDIIKSEEFQYWLKGSLKEQYKYYFKSEYPGPDIINIRFDLKDTIPKTQFPLSIIPNHLMDFAFMEIYSRASAAASYDFDSLFIPFLCIGSDISNNKEVIFRKGELAQAVRASMTFPLYFRPILMNGSIMYDGGIYNNFPVERLKEAFHPDVIIGSKAARGNHPPDEFDLMAQVENIVMNPIITSIDSREGILLDMEFDNPSLLEFDRVDEYVSIGYQTALLKMDSIKMMISRRSDPDEKLSMRRKTFKEKWPELKFNRIQINGLSDAQQYYIEHSIKRTDSVLSIDALKREYLKLVNDKNLRYIYPLAHFNRSDSLFTLSLRVIPSSPLEARFGLYFASTGLAQTYLGLSYRDLGEVATHVRGSLQFGRLYDGVNLGIRFDYPSHIPVYFQGSFNYNRYDYNLSNPNFFFEDLEPSYIIENEVNFRFDIGFPYSMNGVIRSGLGVGRNMDTYYQNQEFSSGDTSDVSNISLVSLYLAGESNTLNDKQFSTKGYYRKLAVRGGYGIENYIPGSTSEQVNNARLNYFWVTAEYEETGYIPLKNKFSLGYYYRMQATFKPLLNNYYSTIIEAPVFKPNIISKGLFLEDYRAYQYIAAGLMPLYTFSDQWNARVEMYGFFPLQEIINNGNNGVHLGSYFKTMHSIFSASLNYMSPLGPLGFHVGYLSAEDNPWVVQLSFGYLIFNKSSTDE